MMNDLSIGDLVSIDPRLDRRGLYLELRDPDSKYLYATPRLVVDPDDFAIVLDMCEESAMSLILTSKGQRGWLESYSLHVISHL